MVARSAGGREVAGSNPVTPTVKSLIFQGFFLLCCISCCIGFQNGYWLFQSGTRAVIAAVSIFLDGPDSSSGKACSKSIIVAHPAYFIYSPRISPSVLASVLPLFTTSVFSLSIAPVLPLFTTSVFPLSTAPVFPTVTAAIAAPVTALIFPSASSAHTAITIPATIPSTHT